MTPTTPTTIPSRNGIRQPHVSSVSVVIVAYITDHHAADWPHQKSDRKHTKGGEHLGDPILMWEEVPADRGSKIAVNRKIVPLKHVADHACSDHLAFRCGIHLSPIPRWSFTADPPPMYRNRKDAGHIQGDRV